ncbi:GAF domain-containing protein [Chloroflexi bacterium CFX2]|nr:GAF domain-containing protein [Chloroflexi bacterium CFX2]
MQIRVLLIEDSSDDAALVVRELERNGYEVEFNRIETEGEMRLALAEKTWDVIVCDYSLPRFNAMRALSVLHEIGLDLPFIIVSGSISEESAVTALKAGAHDFLVKEKYARLAPAVRREIKDAEIRRHRRRAEDALRRGQAQLLSLIENAPVSIAMFDREMKYIVASRRWMEEYGEGHPGLIGLYFYDIHPDLPEQWKEAHRRGLAGESLGRDNDMWVRADGTTLWLRWMVVPWHNPDGEIGGIIIFSENTTERKRAEDELRRRDEELQRRNTELERLYRASEALLSDALMDRPSLARTIVNTVLREFRQSNCSLLLLNNETRQLERIAVEGPYAEEVADSILGLDQPGLVAKAVRSGQVINVPDVASDPDYLPNWKAARSEMVVPLKVGGDVIGALDVQSPEPGAFHEEDERLMTIFAERAALALERTRLNEQTVKQLERLAALRVIDLAISSSFDLRLMLNTVLEQVVDQLGVDATSILLFKPESGRLEFVLGRGFHTRGIESSSLRPGEGYAGAVAVERRIIHVPDLNAVKDQFVRRDLLEGENFVSYFGVPLITKGELKGVLELFHRSHLKTDMEWLSFLDALGWQTAIAVDNAILFEKIQRSNFELVMAYDATIEGWSHAMDLRDKETEGHTRRVTEMTLNLAKAMGVSDNEIVHLRRGALLHDIGKMGVPDNILLKPDKLTEAEWEIMRRHPQYAYEMLASIPYLRPALDIPYSHHEKWDGTGYPRGLSGTEIPLAARLFAVVDVWDAITSDRPYRKKWTRQQALKYIREQSGKHFDPAVVEVFLREIAGLKPKEHSGQFRNYKRSGTN